MTSSASLSVQPPPPGVISWFRSVPARQAATFVGLVYLMVVAIALALPHNPTAVKISMVTPAVALVLITAFRTPRGQRGQLWASLGLRRLGLRSWPVAFGVAVTVILLIPYGVASLLGSAAAQPLNPSLTAWANGSLNLAINLAFVTVMALTEEVGWRGYLLPRVQTLVSPRRAALVVGLIHGGFHLPLVVLTTTYNSVGSRWIVAPLLVASLTAAGVLYAWLKDRSGSIWPVAVAHSTINTFIDGGGLIVVLSPVALAYTAAEGGVVTLLTTAATAALLLVRGRTWATTRPVGARSGETSVHPGITERAAGS